MNEARGDTGIFLYCQYKHMYPGFPEFQPMYMVN